MISAMATAFTFAAEEAAPEQAAPNAVETCQAAIDNATKDIPANATAAKYSLAGAKQSNRGGQPQQDQAAGVNRGYLLGRDRCRLD